MWKVQMVFNIPAKFEGNPIKINKATGKYK
jgi:hypothetical protein